MRTWKAFSKKANKLTRADFMFELHMEMRTAYVETDMFGVYLWCNRRGAWEWVMCAFLIEILSQNKRTHGNLSNYVRECALVHICVWRRARTRSCAHLQWRQLFIVCFHCFLWKSSGILIGIVVQVSSIWIIFFLLTICSMPNTIYTKCISSHNNTLGEKRRDEE